MTKPTSADGQINNKNKQISRSEASLQGWTNEFGGEIWVENAGKTKWRMKGCSFSNPPRWAHPQTPLGDVSLPLVASCILNSQLNLTSAFSFFPQSWSLQTPPGSLFSLNWECWTEMDSAEMQKSRSGYVFIIWFEENIKEKGKTCYFVLNLGVVSMTCTSSCTRVCETLLCPNPNKFMIHRWAGAA